VRNKKGVAKQAHNFGPLLGRCASSVIDPLSIRAPASYQTSRESRLGGALIKWLSHLFSHAQYRAPRSPTAWRLAFVLPTGILQQDFNIIDEQEDHIVLTVRVPLDLIRDNRPLLMALLQIAEKPRPPAEPEEGDLDGEGEKTRTCLSVAKINMPRSRVAAPGPFVLGARVVGPVRAANFSARASP